MAESDEDDYVYYGTSLQDEGDTTTAAAGSKKDPALTRYVSICTDMQQQCHQHAASGAIAVLPTRRSSIRTVCIVPICHLCSTVQHAASVCTASHMRLHGALHTAQPPCNTSHMLSLHLAVLHFTAIHCTALHCITFCLQEPASAPTGSHR
jgi:hypothetical protein